MHIGIGIGIPATALMSGGAALAPFWLATGLWNASGVWDDAQPFPAPFFLATGSWNPNGVWSDSEVFP